MHATKDGAVKPDFGRNQPTTLLINDQIENIFFKFAALFNKIFIYCILNESESLFQRQSTFTHE